MGNVKPIPDGYHTLIAQLNVKGADRMMEFMKKAFGAEQHGEVMKAPSGQIVHAEMKLGDTIFFVAEAQRDPETQSQFCVYSNDCDAANKRAVDAGAKQGMPPTDMFWGDRFATVKDGWGNVWSIVTHKEDVPRDEMEKRSKAFFAQMQQQQQKP